MIGALQAWRPLFGRLAAGALAGAIYLAARLPAPSPVERQALAHRFHFVALEVPAPPTSAATPLRTGRAVHPRLAHIASWISAVGAAIALADIDGDGLSNDLCYVDTRTDQVVVARAPVGTGAAYAPFALAEPPPGHDATVAPMGCLPADLNEDGVADLLVYYWGRPPVGFLQEAGPALALGPARFRAVEVAPAAERWFTNAATRADLDGDGHLDIVVGNYFPDGARILDASADRDEPPPMQDSMSRAFNGGRDRLLLCRPVALPRSFRCEEAQGVLSDRVARGWTLAAGAADLDGDQRPELYLAHDFGPDRLLHNRSRPGELHFAPLEGRRTFTTPASKVLGRDSFKGMGVDFGDVDGDGRLDIYVSNIASEYALEESHFLFVSQPDMAAAMARGIAPYADRSEELGLARSGWSWEARLADFDNDGTLEAVQATGFVRGVVNRWPELQELAMGNDTLLHRPGSWFRLEPGDDLNGHQPNAFFVRGSDGRYVDMASEVGLEERTVSRGIACADVDGDGDLDLAVANQWAAPVFYRNDAPHPGTFLGLRLLLPSNGGGETRVTSGLVPNASGVSPAIGAAVTVILRDPGTAAVRELVAQVDGGNGHSGKRSPEVHLGLGDWPRDRDVDVELQWRDGRGRARHQSLRLRPGWHTVVLASAPALEDET
jgi:hypothetical protein